LGREYFACDSILRHSVFRFLSLEHGRSENANLLLTMREVSARLQIQILLNAEKDVQSKRISLKRSRVAKFQDGHHARGRESLKQRKALSKEPGRNIACR
jgi:hypothetical protein